MKNKEPESSPLPSKVEILTDEEREVMYKLATDYGQKATDYTRDFHDGINAKHAFIDGWVARKSYNSQFKSSPDSPLNPSGPKVKKRYACRLDEQGCMEECHGNPELKEKCEFCTVTVTDSQELNPSGVDLEESQHWQSFCDELQVGVQRILRDQGAASIEVRNAINDTLTSIIPMFDLTRKKGL